ncbi:MAG: NAD(+) synthase, partial [Clostridia bacterium]|nr:NAD(+) synthase [Clostridia bacterium]
MANAATSESTQDVVFSSHHVIAQSGKILAESRPFEQKSLLISEIDTARLYHDRLRDNNFDPIEPAMTVWFDQTQRAHELTLPVEKNPFAEKDSECALQIQSQGLARRLSHTGARCAVIGISGGLDSTLALLVAARAMDILDRPHSDIEAITMPCFGTTDRTKSNAVTLCEQLGVHLREINIAASVKQHFADIGHDEQQYDVTYENAQARERTQVLMDVANQKNGLVVGTGDLSELALGWATYNGDHMSMYAVNAGIPKTMVRALVRYEAERAANEMLSRVLLDILDTPVSPELLPADAQGNIAQKTEDLVGPYELHDFFLYHVMRNGETPAKIFRLARIAFAGEYDDRTILYWLRVFHRRFFTQQFKRSCMPDGPKVLPVSLSPRGDWRMPSDATARLWLEQIDALSEYLA